jgi:type IV secretory pathway VirB10-like protein
MADPILPAPPPSPSKPFNWRFFVVGICFVLITFIIGAVIVKTAMNAIPTGRKTTQDQPPAPVTPNQISDYNDRTREQVKRFPPPASPPTAARDALDELTGLSTETPEPTPEQRHTEQQYGPNGQGQTGVSPAEQAKLDAKARRQAALQASAVFSTAASGTETPAPIPTSTPEPTTDETQPPAAVRPVSAPTVSAPVQKYPWNSSMGPQYMVLESHIFETVLRNKLAGEFTGPVSVMLTSNVYSLDHQQVLIPQGTEVLGEASKVSSSDQSRLAVTFHRLIMPDGYSVDLDKNIGLDVLGATGLHDKVNHHYLQIFGVAMAVGGIAGLSQINNNGSSLQPSVSLREGITSQTADEATQILDGFLNKLPTIEIRPGTRVRIWLAGDLKLPAYGNHTVSPTL